MEARVCQACPKAPHPSTVAPGPCRPECSHHRATSRFHPVGILPPFVRPLLGKHTRQSPGAPAPVGSGYCTVIDWAQRLEPLSEPLASLPGDHCLGWWVLIHSP